MVNHCGHLTSCVNCKFTHFPQWLLHFSSFKFPTFSPSSLLPDDLVSYSTKKIEAIKRELSHLSMTNFTHLPRSANLFPVVSKDEISFSPIKANSQHMFTSSLLLLYQRFCFFWLTSPLSAYIFIMPPFYWVIFISIQICFNILIIKMKLNKACP